MNTENLATKQSDTNKPLNPESGTNVWLPNYESTNDKRMTEKASEMFSNVKEAISDQFRNLTGSSDKTSTTKDVENFHATTQLDTDKSLNPENGTNVWLPNYENTNNRGMSEKAGEIFSNAKEAISDQFRNLTGNSNKTSTTRDLSSNPEKFHATTQSDTDKPLNPESGTNVWLPNYENTSNRGISGKAGEMLSNAKETLSDQFRNLTESSNKTSTTINNPGDFHGTIQSNTDKPLNPENGTNIWLPNYENTTNKPITEKAGEMFSNAKETISNQWKNVTESTNKSTTTSQNLSNNAENLQENIRQSDTSKPLNPENGTNIWLPNYEQSSS